MDPGRISRLQSNLCRDDYPENSGWHFSNKIDRYYLFHGQSHGHHREIEITLADAFIPSRYRNVTATGGWWELHIKARPQHEWTMVLRKTVDSAFYGDPKVPANAVIAAIAEALKSR